MLIGAGIALFVLLFMGGAQDDLIIMHGEKYVKKVVVDKDRKQLILAEFKAIKSLQKSYQKITKKNTKQFGVLVKNRNTTSNEFQSYIKKLVDEERNTNDQFFSHRLMIQEKLTQEEWDSVIESIQKSMVKDEKSGSKTLKGFEKDLDKMKAKILSVLNEDFRKEKAEKSLNNFIEVVREAGKEIVDDSPEEKELLLQKNTSRDELDEIGDEVISQWVEMLNAISKLHHELSELSTDEEWKTIAKWMNKI